MVEHEKERTFCLLTYYNQFTSEELEELDKQSNDFAKLSGMSEILKIVENKLGKIHDTTCDVRKHVNKFQKERFVISEKLLNKILKQL